jgi:cation:H+ antiporter
MLIAIVFLLLGFGILIIGAEFLVRGSASLAAKMGVSPLVTGLTVVAFGTSAPELVVNIYAAIKGTAEIAIGNIIGSNIFNILFILGIAAIINPIKIKKSTVYKEIPFALLAAVLVFVMGNDIFFDKYDFNAITKTDGIALISLFIIFMVYTFGLAKSEFAIEEIRIYSYRKSFLLTLAGLVSLFIGGKILVDNAVILARLAGLSETLIGLTIVAIGTSLPELATAVVATVHHHDDIVVGNIVGSNIFNVFWVLGLTSVISPLSVNFLINIDVLVCIFATLLLFLFTYIGRRHRLDRWQGILFVLLYAVYLVYSVQQATS